MLKDELRGRREAASPRGVRGDSLPDLRRPAAPRARGLAGTDASTAGTDASAAGCAGDPEALRDREAHGGFGGEEGALGGREERLSSGLETGSGPFWTRREPGTPGSGT